MLTGKKVVLGVSGSIAAYKMANVASMLVKLHCDVRVILTEAGAKFITPDTFEALTKNHCLMDSFERSSPVEIHHITLGQTSDLILAAPASADILGKIAHGIADDLLTSTIVAATCPVLVAPAMNSHMYENPIVQENIARLKGFGYEFIEPAVGHLACNVEGVGKLPEESVVVHMDLIAGLSSKVEAVDFISCYTRADGIISTRIEQIKRAKELSLSTIYRIFVIDSKAIDNLNMHIKDYADIVEILPGLMPKIIKIMASRLGVPIIAGGLISEKEDVLSALKAGAIAISTTNPNVWEM